MPTNWKAIFLGNTTTTIDPVEGSNQSEDANLLVGRTFGSESDPLSRHTVLVTTIDIGGDPNALDSNNNIASDQIRFDLKDGAGIQTTVFDGVAEYNATITLRSGVTATVTAVVFQDADGNLFLAPEYEQNADSAIYQADGIQTMSLNSLLSATGTLQTSRQQTSFVCFTRGTRLQTPTGQKPVEELRRGDLLLTADNGAQPVAWIARRKVEGVGKSAPIVFGPGSLGAGLPMRRLRVSRHHRMLITSRLSEHLFGTAEVFIPARLLTAFSGIRKEDRPQIEYLHILMDRHEVVFAEGAPTESLYPGDQALRMIGVEGAVKAYATRQTALERGQWYSMARFAPDPADCRKLVEMLVRRGERPITAGQMNLGRPESEARQKA